MKKILYLLAMVLSFNMVTSCVSEYRYYQVYEIKSQDVSQHKDILNYENDVCIVSYNLWSEGGNLSFLIYNKTNNNLYIVMPQSFFILNGVANDYYSESTYGFTAINSVALNDSRLVSVKGFLSDGYFWYPSRLSRQIRVSASNAISEYVETKEVPFVCIPPNSSRFIKGFNLSDYIYINCEDYRENYPKETSSVVSYTKENTPLSFRNRIAYTFDTESSDVKYIENQFWLSSLQNYSEKAAISKREIEECESKAKKTQRYFKMYSPNKFYNCYKINLDAPYTKYRKD